MAELSIDSLQKGSDIIEDYCCSTCEEDYVSTEADFYCEICLKFYCCKCIHLHSQLFKRHSASGREEMCKWPVGKGMLDFIEKCEDHQDEKLKVFCEDHRQLCCSTCVMLHHRQCSKLTLISESAKIPTKADFQQLSEKLQTIQQKITELQNGQNDNLSSLQTSYTFQFQKIREMRKKINAQLDELEKVTVKALDELNAKLNHSFKTDVDKFSKLEVEIKSLNKALNAAENKRGEVAFMAYNKCMNKIQQTESYLLESPADHESALTFQPNPEIELYFSKLSALGNVEIIVHNNIFIPVKTNRVVFEEMHNIRGICEFPNGQIVIADDIKKKVKLLDQKYEVISSSDLSYGPWDMCQVSSNEVAVTVDDFNDVHQVQFITENKGSLIKCRKIRFEHICLGIACHQNDLFVTSRTALYHYTLSGSMVKKMYEDSSVWKCSVSPTGDRIYVTNNSQHQLLTLNVDGTVLSTFQDPELRGPYGMHVTSAGYVLVCGQYSETVLQLGRKGEQKVATLVEKKDGLPDPVSVYYSEKNRTIMVEGLNTNRLFLLTVK
ncbi:uncharacterized protein LOC127861527 isoform X3 [Dreissena polymorpha]|uniref:B box-type domain-containing protein n=1 Tax=Dreissena polymorpha TaxID=45954 RepID=A0A9D4BBF3_DREPO|nr:uncharacterized protein LOC127861527 isoform X3 [Dreissena polymorpha]KAH3696306.1 hypothetical protein DPMN_083771 [Dreissena polymorpha]